MADVGGSMFLHTFGAYFGLAVARVLYNKEIEHSTKNGSNHHSDVFAMIGECDRFKGQHKSKPVKEEIFLHVKELV